MSFVKAEGRRFLGYDKPNTLKSAFPLKTGEQPIGGPRMVADVRPGSPGIQFFQNLGKKDRLPEAFTSRTVGVFPFFRGQARRQ